MRVDSSERSLRRPLLRRATSASSYYYRFPIRHWRRARSMGCRCIRVREMLSPELRWFMLRQSHAGWWVPIEGAAVHERAATTAA